MSFGLGLRLDLGNTAFFSSTSFLFSPSVQDAGRLGRLGLPWLAFTRLGAQRRLTWLGSPLDGLLQLALLCAFAVLARRGLKVSVRSPGLEIQGFKTLRAGALED